MRQVLSNARSEDARSEIAEARPRDDLELKLQRVLQENQALTTHKQNLEALLADILSSTSWRITSPLRTAARWARAILPLYRSRRHALTLIPAKNVTRDGDKFKVTGPSASLDVASNFRMMPSGWLLLEGRMDLSSETSFFYLYFANDSGHTE